MSGMNEFVSRVSNVLDVVSTLGQFERLNLEHTVKGLPRFAGLWTLESFEGKEGEDKEECLSQSFTQSEGISIRTGMVPGNGSVSDITLATPDYLEMLTSKNASLQHQQQLVASPGGGGGGGGGRSEIQSGALSTLKEESWVESVQGEEERDHKQQGSFNESIVIAIATVSLKTICNCLFIFFCIIVINCCR